MGRRVTSIRARAPCQLAGLRSEDSPPDERAWSISCFYVHRSVARTGVGNALLTAAIARAARHGASAVEAYPVKVGNVDPYTGYDTMFTRAGFRLLKAGRGRGRALYRRDLGSRPGSDE